MQAAAVCTVLLPWEKRQPLNLVDRDKIIALMPLSIVGISYWGSWNRNKWRIADLAGRFDYMASFLVFAGSVYCPDVLNETAEGKDQDKSIENEKSDDEEDGERVSNNDGSQEDVVTV